MPTPKKSKALARLRQKGPKFRLNKNRDDLNPGFDTVRVFFRSRLLHAGDSGVYGCPVVVLMGYKAVQTSDAGGTTKLHSVKADPDSYIVGRMAELHPDELARLDQVAEAGGDFHRFLAEVKGPGTGAVFSAWVYQHRSDAGELEQKTSATELAYNRPQQLSLPFAKS